MTREDGKTIEKLLENIRDAEHQLHFMKKSENYNIIRFSNEGNMSPDIILDKDHYKMAYNLILSAKESELNVLLKELETI
jgi:hypothetical protein